MTSADFLLELLSEEIPARMQDKASADLARLFSAEIAKAGLSASAIETYATPRRLALIARDLPLATEPVSEELKGPRADAPAQALAGFLGKTGLTRDQLVERADAKGNLVLYAVTSRPGRPTADVLAEAIPAIIRAFPWPKAMRWGDQSVSTASLRWVRPLKGIVPILGEDLVPIEIDGIQSGFGTVGHRFHHPGVITIGGAEDYAAKLRACHVILDPAERRAIIAEGAAAAASAQGLSVVPDEGLLAENAGLTEWPVPLLGSFDPAFLDVPREVIQLTMRTNQKYFALTDATGALAPAFLCTANIAAADDGASIVAGNQKVLAARLSDAKFFWENDLKVPLDEQAAKLKDIVFHEKLGTIHDKVERVVKLARWLVEEGIVKPAMPAPATAFPSEVEGPAPSAAEAPATRASAALGTSGPSTALGEAGDGERAHLADQAERAARLCKADLVTGMVGEFPELQGIIGGYLASAQGEDAAVADAIRDHYKPVGQGDEVPTAPVTVAVSLADKLDTLFAFFGAAMPPTGSRDPFALRRAALGVISITLQNNLRWSLDGAITAVLHEVNQVLPRAAELQFAVVGDNDGLLDFFADRLKVQQREAGVRHDLIDAVFALGGEDDLVRLLARVHALQAFVATDDGVNLLAGYKRAANILRIEEKKEAPLPTGEGGARSAEPSGRVRATDDLALSYTPEKEEAGLMAALSIAEPRARAAIAAEDFEDAMAALAALRAPIDAFFDAVTVNDADPAKRSARLALLARVRAAVHQAADFSRIEG